MTADLSVLVLGGGPAGITAALQARELGARVTLLEARRVGGTSLNRGPAPVRTLARAARLARDWSSWETFGLAGPAPVPDLAAVLANSERVARYAHDKKDIAGHLNRLGIELAENLGPVGFTGPHTVEAVADAAARPGDARSGSQRWTADRIIIAVGGRAARLPIPGAELALTYEDIMSLDALPARVAVIGGADTGCQIASIFADLGSMVTVFEAGQVLVPSADVAVSTGLGRAFIDRGLTVATGTMVEALSRDPAGDGIRIDYRHTPADPPAAGAAAAHASADVVFMAVGWPANTRPLNLDAAGVKTCRGTVIVDEYLRTSAGHIFAAGDVDGHTMLVQTARMEGRIAAKNAVLGPARQATYDVVPSGSFTDPEYGRVGLTEAEAAQRHDIVVGVAWYDDLVRPVADGRPDGFCKLIADRGSHRLVGGHVLGEYSAETVQTVAACMAAGLTAEQVAELQLAYPTFTEGMSMAAQMICREIGTGRFPQAWSYLGTGQ
jgi:pyruvate/2-oxoglutarate dehydrogenase complex dihydrolipoamide dehydrogenase (E3) component